ncbi:MAG: MBL fold metallo-hydrolase [Promethearchaeota archaeon]
MTSITIYDGNDTIGGNKIYVEEEGEGVFLDFGTNFSNFDNFYKWPKGPRAHRGIYDYWMLNLIPHLDIYRKDLIPSDLDIAGAPQLDVKAVLLSHVHSDHFGNIGLLDESIPVVASTTTLALLKGIQDTVTQNIGSEVIYTNRRRPDPSDPRVLFSGKKYGRSLITTDPCNEKVEEFFWQRSRKTSEIAQGTVQQLKDCTLPFTVTPYETDHSVYGSLAYILEGDHCIAYTGDIRLHGKNKQKSIDFVKKHAKGCEVLIIEGTRLTGENIFDSEDFVYDFCYRAVDMAKGLVIADFTSRNLERLELFKKVAEDTNRQLIITDKDAYLLYVLELVDGIDHLHDVNVYQRFMSKAPYWEEEILRKKKDPHYITHKEINANPDDYVICFSSYNIENFLDIIPKKGIYIYSSTGVYKAEQEFDFVRLNKWLHFSGMPEEGIIPKGFRIEDIDGKDVPVFTRGFHASGHASEDELYWMIDRIDPDIIIPVHTECPSWFAENFGDRVKLLEKGEKLKI